MDTDQLIARHLDSVLAAAPKWVTVPAGRIEVGDGVTWATGPDTRATYLVTAVRRDSDSVVLDVVWPADDPQYREKRTFVLDATRRERIQAGR